MPDPREAYSMIPDWIWPFPPMAGGEGEHDHGDPARAAADDIVRETGAAITDAIEAAEHSPGAAAEIPHDLHAELVQLHARHDAHDARLAEHESTFQGIHTRLDELGRRVDDLVAAPPRVAEEAEETAEQALELPVEVIEPRRRHPFLRLPKWA
jgi:hypothetical protein